MSDGITDAAKQTKMALDRIAESPQYYVTEIHLKALEDILNGIILSDDCHNVGLADIIAWVGNIRASKDTFISRQQELDSLLAWFEEKGKSYWGFGALEGYVEFEKELMRRGGKLPKRQRP